MPRRALALTLLLPALVAAGEPARGWLGAPGTPGTPGPAGGSRAPKSPAPSPRPPATIQDGEAVRWPEAHTSASDTLPRLLPDRELLSHKGDAFEAVASADGAWIASYGEDGRILVRDTKDWIVRHAVPIEGASPRDVIDFALSADGRYLAAGGDTSLKAWDLKAPGKAAAVPLAEPPDQWVRSGQGLGFLADPDRLVTVTERRGEPGLRPVSWQLPRGALDGTFEDWPWAEDLHTLRFLQTPQGPLLANIGNADYSYLYASGVRGENPEGGAWPLRGGRSFGDFVARTAGGKLVVETSIRGDAVAELLEGVHARRFLVPPRDPRCFHHLTQVDAGGRWLAWIHGPEDPYVLLWDLRTLRPAAILKTPKAVWLMGTFTGDGRAFVLGARDGSLLVWDLAGGRSP